MGNNNGKTYICPLLNGPCQTLDCQLYEVRLNNCVFKVLNYNLYRLHEVESRRIERELEAEKQANTLDQPGPPVNRSMNDLFI